MPPVPRAPCLPIPDPVVYEATPPAGVAYRKGARPAGPTGPMVTKPAPCGSSTRIEHSGQGCSLHHQCFIYPSPRRLVMLFFFPPSHPSRLLLLCEVYIHSFLYPFSVCCLSRRTPVTRLPS